LPSYARRRRRQQLVEYRPALSILRLVYQLPWGLKSTRLQKPLRCKRPPGPGTSLRTTLFQDPASKATNGSWATPSDKGLQQRST
jgi:hypothetical protein